MQPHIAQQHDQCTCEIRYKKWANQRLVPGLICADHNLWIDWLNDERAQELIDSGLVQVKPWIELAQQPDKAKPKRVLKTRQRKKQSKWRSK
jgi:hypothetical protein